MMDKEHKEGEMLRVKTKISDMKSVKLSLNSDIECINKDYHESYEHKQQVH